MSHKLAFFDMDGTITAPWYRHDDGTYTLGFPAQDWIRYCKQRQNHTYDECPLMTPVIEYATQLKALGYKLFILTVTLSDEECNAKMHYFNNHHLDDIFDHIIFADHDDHKIEIIHNCAHIENVELEDCTLVEDTLSTLLTALKYHITAVHVSNIITGVYPDP